MTEVSESQVQDVEAYVLFYQKKTDEARYLNLERTSSHFLFRKREVAALQPEIERWQEAMKERKEREKAAEEEIHEITKAENGNGNGKGHLPEKEVQVTAREQEKVTWKRKADEAFVCSYWLWKWRTLNVDPGPLDNVCFYSNIFKLLLW